MINKPCLVSFITSVNYKPGLDQIPLPHLVQHEEDGLIGAYIITKNLYPPLVADCSDTQG